jgi:pyruvate,water dikinase
MTMLGNLLQRIGLPANSFEMLARDETGERPPMKMSIARLLLHRRVIRFLARRTRARGQISKHIDVQNRALASYRIADFSKAETAELMASIRDLMTIHGRSQWNVFLAAVNMMIRKHLLDRFLRKHANDVTAADLLHGLTQLKSLEPNRRFDEMAHIARGLDGGSREQLKTSSDKSIRHTLAASASGRDLIANVDRFLADYGFLSANGTDFSTESWVERPELVWQTIGRLTGGPFEPDHEPVQNDGSQLKQRVDQSLGRLHRLWFRRLLESTVSYMDLRERTSLLLSEDAYHMRRVFLQLGDRLVHQGVLSTPDEIFYLYIEELRGVVSGEWDTSKVKPMIEERRMEMDADADIEPFDTICGETVPPRAAMYTNGGSWYPGIGGSPGVAEGRVVIVQDPSEAPPNLTRRDILVVPFTDIGWTPLFVGIGGIVAETGGQLSHTCIVAREYNLPAVVSVRGATRIFENGQPITIDGHRGRVHVGHILNQERSAK